GDRAAPPAADPAGPEGNEARPRRAPRVPRARGRGGNGRRPARPAIGGGPQARRRASSSREGGPLPRAPGPPRPGILDRSPRPEKREGDPQILRAARRGEMKVESTGMA